MADAEQIDEQDINDVAMAAVRAERQRGDVLQGIKIVHDQNKKIIEQQTRMVQFLSSIQSAMYLIVLVIVLSMIITACGAFLV